MGAKRKSYTPKYRQEAAHLVIDTGRTIAAVAREIGVGEQLLGRWVAIERSRMDDSPEAIDADERAELVRLRREVAELRMDREFLKSSGLLRSRELESEQAFAVIEAEKATPDMPPVARMADLLGVNHPGFSGGSLTGGMMSHGSTKEVPGGVEGSGDATGDGRSRGCVDAAWRDRSGLAAAGCASGGVAQLGPCR